MQCRKSRISQIGHWDCLGVRIDIILKVIRNNMRKELVVCEIILKYAENQLVD